MSGFLLIPSLFLLQVKKRQQESLLILDTIKIDYKVIDITEPGHEEERDMMKEICKKRNSDPLPLSPQFFNNDDYCGVSIMTNAVISYSTKSFFFSPTIRIGKTSSPQVTMTKSTHFLSWKSRQSVS